MIMVTYIQLGISILNILVSQRCRPLVCSQLLGPKITTQKPLFAILLGQYLNASEDGSVLETLLL